MAVAQWLPRAMNSTELGYIRTDGQASLLYLAIFLPPSVYTARVNQTFSSKDKILEVIYDGGAGTLADIKPGMSMYVGSFAGGQDLGIVRVRKDPTSSIMYVGENSDVLWEDDAYLTVVDDFALWARHIAIADRVPYMDGDIAYSNQHSATSPVPVIGPRYVPVWRDSPTVVVPFDASNSWVFPDTTIAAYAWSAPGASATSGMTTATPDITYDADGTYRVSCAITAANGNVTTAYAHVEVYSSDRMPITEFSLDNCVGSHSAGGWKFQVTMYSQADMSTVLDRAMVVLFTKDYYGTNQVSIGQIPGRENIIATGWISGESITEDPDGSSVSFAVEGTSSWLKRITGFPIGIQNVTTTADAWTNWQNLTVDKSLYHLFLWQSTVIPVVDVFLTGDLRISPEQYAPGDCTLADQFNYLLKNTIMGMFGDDRFGRIFCEVDVQLTPPADRSSFNTVIDLELIDWRDAMRISRTIVPSTSQVNLSGVAINLPEEATPLFSLAPGHTFLRWGKPVKLDRLLLSDQAQSNELAALKLAWDNHTLEFEPDLAGNNRMLDVFPSHQFVGVVVNSSETPREFLYDGHAIVREINISVDKAEDGAGFLQISWRMEEETFPGNSSNGDTPESSTPGSTSPPLSPLPPLPSAPSIIVAPIVPSTLGNLQILVRGQGMYYTKNLSGPGVVRWFSMNQGLPDPTQVVALEVNRYGRCYCQVANESVWSAPYPGAPWVLVFDTTMIGVPEPVPFPRAPFITSIGIDRDSPDTLLIAAGIVASIFTTYLIYNFTGSSAGVTLATPIHYNTPPPVAGGLGVGNATFGDGSWYVSFDAGLKGAMKFNAAGVVPETTELAITTAVHTRSRYSPDAVVVQEIPGISISQDGGDTFLVDTDFTPNTDGQSVSTNPAGNLVLLGTALDGMRRSSDGGSTWGITATFAAVQAVWNLGTDEDWIFTFVSEVLYTPDFGATFVYKTGDLKSWIGPFAVISIVRHHDTILPQPSS